MTMTPHMDDPTLAEVYRAVLRVEQQVLRVNGRVGMLELGSAHVEERMTVIERAHLTCPILRPGLSVGAIHPAPTNWKQLTAGLAVIGGAVWLAVELLWRMGDWLHTLGVR